MCTPPKGITACEATCPMGTTIKYKSTIKCVASTTTTADWTDWIEANSDKAAGVTCELPPYSPLATGTPPTGIPACTPLGSSACTAFQCDPAQLIYAPSGKGYIVTCKEGSLVVDDQQFVDVLTVPCESGTWTPPITSANCVVKDKVAQVQACLDEMTDGTIANNIIFECVYGTCYMSCK
ncbi:hypothetical protein PENTCL1PPCAC_28020, partial [Pristionchus entomophagus]